MIKRFDEEFPENEEDFDLIPDELKQTNKGNTVEISNKGFSQKMVQQLFKNQLKIAKLKLKLLINEKKTNQTILKRKPFNQRNKGDKIK